MKKISSRARSIALSFALLAPISLPAATYTYSGASGTDWNTAADWTPNGVPGAGDTALFNQQNTVASYYSVTGSATVGTINLAATFASPGTNGFGYAIGGTTANTTGTTSGAYTLTMNNGSSDAAITQLSTNTANNIINSALVIAGNNVLDITNSKGQTFTTAGLITPSSTTAATTLNVVANNTSGTSTISLGGTSDTNSNLTINLTTNLGLGQISLSGSTNTTAGTIYTGNINLLQGYATLNVGAGLGTTGTLTIGTSALGTSSKSTFNINGKTSVVKNFTLYGFGAGYAYNGGTTTTTADGALENLVASVATTSGSVTLGSDANIYVVSGGGLTLSGVVSGAHNLIMGSATAADTTGTGTLTLSAPTATPNTFSGGLTINAGSVVSGSTGTAVFGSGNVAFGTSNTPTLDLNGHNATVGLLSGAGTNGIVTNNSATASQPSVLTLNGTGSQTFAGSIKNGATNTVALTLSAGTQTLSGTANTYTGNTTINGGTLAVTGSITTSPTVAVNSTGTLTGTGSVSAITLNSGGNVSPGTAGTSTGMLTGTTLTFNGGGTLTFTLSGTSNATGLLNLSGALTQGLAGTYGINLSGGMAGTTYELASFTGGTTFAATSFTDTGSTPGTFSISNNQLLFSATAVPEPSTWAMALLLCGTCVWRIVRRRTVC